LLFFFLKKKKEEIKKHKGLAIFKLGWVACESSPIYWLSRLQRRRLAAAQQGYGKLN
jgi:hypothetical protein